MDFHDCSGDGGNVDCPVYGCEFFQRKTRGVFYDNDLDEIYYGAYYGSPS